MIGLVISNCQGQSLKHALTLMCKDMIFENFSVHLLDPTTRENVIETFIAENKQRYSVILSIELSNNFLGLSSERVRETFSDIPVFTIPNLYFSGLHPDLTYIGGLATRVISPIGDYHSKLCLAGFLTGLTAGQTEALYGDAVYSKAGYYEEFDRSLEEIRRREASLDVPFADELLDLLKNGLCFFSFNHPTSLITYNLSKKIADHLAQHDICKRTAWPDLPSTTGDFLSNGAMFPIFPEIARFHGLSYPGSYMFKPHTYGDTPVMPFTLDEFVYESFKSYMEVGADTILKAHQMYLIDPVRQALAKAS